MSEMFTRARIFGLAFAAFIAVIDQVLKRYVTGALGINSIGDSMEIVSFFNLTYVENRGMSLGMFQAESMEARWALVLITAAIALIVLVWMMREKLMGDILGLAMILGGAIGNIYDRYTFGFVIDYADFHIGTFRPFLVFNVADAAITIGVVIILARSLFMREKDEDEMGASAAPSEN